jgi:ferredoxin
VINNCPTDVISYDEEADTLVVDEELCVYCRQCEVASDGAFEVEMAWEGDIALRREQCLEDCLACADICPTRALYIDDEGELQLADYYCIKCGACVEVCPVVGKGICPVKPIVKEEEITFEIYGVTKTQTVERVVNVEEMPIWVERWRVRHESVQSGAWIQALIKLADERAGAVEIERKRALRRRDLLKALVGGQALVEQETRPESRKRPELIRALEGGEDFVARDEEG